LSDFVKRVAEQQCEELTIRQSLRVSRKEHHQVEITVTL
jgi:hypothetical protein